MIKPDLIVHDYNGYCLYQREKDGYVNLTAMAKLYGKQLSDWTRYNDFKSYTLEVSAVTGIPREELLIVVRGGDKPQGTWAHRLIALAFAKWLDPSFHVWCNQHLIELIETGVTTINQEAIITEEDNNFWFYLEKLMDMKPMLEKDIDLAKQMFKHIYNNM